VGILTPVAQPSTLLGILTHSNATFNAFNKAQPSAQLSIPLLITSSYNACLEPYLLSIVSTCLGVNSKGLVCVQPVDVDGVNIGCGAVLLAC